MSNVVKALGTQTVDSHVEGWNNGVKVKWEMQDLGTAEVRASVIMMDLKKDE